MCVASLRDLRLFQFPIRNAAEVVDDHKEDNHAVGLLF